MADRVKLIKGFSKLNKEQKRSWIANTLDNPKKALTLWESFDHIDRQTQKVLDNFAENTFANFILPLGIAPNVVIDDKVYAVPMAVEESSVVAAASAASKFWSTRGGIKTYIVDTIKEGQLLFEWSGSYHSLKESFDDLKKLLLEESSVYTANMEKRGGGVIGLELYPIYELDNTFEIRGKFQTCDSMGANFINTILECWGEALPKLFEFVLPVVDLAKHGEPEIVMAILTNYTPSCVIEAKVSCQLSEFGDLQTASRIKKAVDIANASTERAVTHNKGVMNGVDSVVIATGNDFRAVEAAAHAFAAKDGKYRSLTKCTIENDTFTFQITLPIAIGTVGGLTKLHPLAKENLEILGNPSAPELMRIIASIGLMQNFAAVRSLVTSGIQSGHMKMHLQNILTQLKANDDQRKEAKTFFADKTISYSAVREWLQEC